MKCRHCQTVLNNTFCDLGFAPPSNAYISPQNYNAPETWYPLKVMVCNTCWLVQTEDHAGREELFTAEYAYFSSTSASWLAHAKNYVTDMTARFDLGAASMICEVAANDGYLLRHAKELGIPCFGVEPTTSTAKAARALGLEIIEEFFGEALGKKLATQGKSADLTAANNVLAHVPDINDFVKGFAAVLKPQGVSTFEFPHLLNLVQLLQFDTIYHEHYSYLSLLAVQTIFEKNGLSIFDVQELPTHGGSLRVFAQRTDTGKHGVTKAVADILAREKAAHLNDLKGYEGFQNKAEAVKNNLVKFLIDAQQQGKKVGAYGAAAKGNTMLNFAGVRPDLLPFVVDKSPGKMGQFLPGSHIPITDEDRIRTEKPDFVLILPWNLRAEISAQLAYIREWGGQFVVAVPKIEVF